MVDDVGGFVDELTVMEDPIAGQVGPQIGVGGETGRVR